jgi:hypothetical protein
MDSKQNLSQSLCLTSVYHFHYLFSKVYSKLIRKLEVAPPTSAGILEYWNTEKMQ